MVRQVAILGGGIAGLAAAWALSETPALRRRAQVTVYERSWLLGGKGASVRGGPGDRRIHEHGLHVIMGHYHEVRALMRACYRELNRPADAPLARFEQALRPLDRIIMGEQAAPRPDVERDAGATDWRFWECMFPRDDVHRLHARQLPLRAIEVAAAFSGQRAGARDRTLERLLTALRGVNAWLRDDEHDTRRRSRLLSELFRVLARGLTRDRVLTRGLDALDGEDLRAWLSRHGASAELLQSAPARVMYDVLFARLDGDPARERLAAGTALRFGLRMLLDYEGAFFWLMTAGMGETIFAPLYQVLRKRGVRFRFFHEVRELRLDAHGAALERVELRQLATPRGLYEPLIERDGLPCWRATPDPDQLVEGDAVRRAGVSFHDHAAPWPGRARVTLQRGRDFDDVVLAIPVAAQRRLLARELPRLPRFAAMLDAVPTNGTLSCQLWLRQSTAQLGRGATQFAMTTFADPVATVADMSHLLELEGHGDEVQGLLYLTSSLPPEIERRGVDAEEALRRACQRWLERHGVELLPSARCPETGEFDWRVLHDPEDREGPARLRAQYFRVNAHGSERYTLAPPGGAASRLRPDDTGVEHLLVAGDWTHSSLPCGCLEGATDSGLTAGRAIAAKLRRARKASASERLRAAASRLTRRRASATTL